MPGRVQRPAVVTLKLDPDYYNSLSTWRQSPYASRHCLLKFRQDGVETSLGEASSDALPRVPSPPLTVRTSPGPVTRSPSLLLHVQPDLILNLSGPLKVVSCFPFL